MARGVIGIDQGSSATKAVLLDDAGRCHLEAHIAVSTQHPAAGEYEQDALELLASVHELVHQAVQVAENQHMELVGLGMATQRSGVLAWDEAGNPLTPVYTWRDSQAQAELDGLGAGKDKLCALSGLPVIPQLAGPKIARLQRQFPDSSVRIGTLDSFFVQRLTHDTFSTDDSMASRTLLYDIKKGGWNGRACELLGVHVERLPEIRPSLGSRGWVEGVPLTALLGDRQAALYREGLFGRGALLNIGTLVSIVVKVEEHQQNAGWLPGVFLTNGKTPTGKHRSHIIEGALPALGRTLLYLKQKLGKDSAALQSIWKENSRARTNWPLAFVAFGGSGSPTWKMDVPSVVTGWDGASENALALALLEGMAFALADVIGELRAEGLVKGDVAVSGGLDSLDFLLQEAAGISSIPLVLSGDRSSGALGVAYGAWHGAVGSKRVIHLPRETVRRVVPSNSEAGQARFQRWRELRHAVLSGTIPHEAREITE